MNLYSIVERMAKEFPDRDFVIDDEARLSYSEFDRRVSGVAAALRGLDVGPGDRVAVILHNSSLMLELMYGCAKIGAVWLPINWRLAPPEWRFILEHSDARVVIMESEFEDAFDHSDVQFPEILKLVVGGSAQTGTWDDVLASDGGGEIDTIPVALDHPARLMYTSGTTANPKGVVITHANVLFKNAAYEREFRLSADDAVLMVAPLFHVGGLDAPGISLANQGGKLVIMKAFDSQAVLSAIEDEAITSMFLAPTMVATLLEDLDKNGYRDLSTVKLLVCGSAQTPHELLLRTLDAFPNAAIVNGYGMTETVGGDIFLDMREFPDKLGSVGRLSHPMLYQQLRIVDDSGVDVGVGVAGEILISGAKTSPGYWLADEAGEAAFKDGWFRTGDIGTVDEDGYLFIVDRKKDMIKSGGENIGSLEIERVVHGFDEVQDVAAVGVPDDHWGEVPVVFITLFPDTELTSDEVRVRCERELARFKVPKGIYFVSSLPRVASGKVRKDKLRERATSLRLGTSVSGR